ncbi:dihydrodipicolinate synthase family protein [Nitrospinota bacterium]
MPRTIQWRGLFPATILPLKENYTIDEPELRVLIRFLMTVRGVNGLACNGHAGDCWSLTREERNRVTQIHMEETGGRLPIVCGVSGECTRDYIELMKDTKEAGASGVLVVPPPIFRNISVQGPEAPYTFFHSLAQAVDIPIIVFQHSVRRGNHYSPETLAKLTEIENVVAVKEAVGDLKLYERDLVALRQAPRRISILASSDIMLFPCFALGHSVGSLISLGSLAPHWMVEMIEAFEQGNLVRAREIYERLFHLVDLFYNTPGVNNSAFIKEALYMLGVLSSPCISRPPHPTFTEKDREAIRRVLEESGLAAFYEKLDVAPSAVAR